MCNDKLNKIDNYSLIVMKNVIKSSLDKANADKANVNKVWLNQLDTEYNTLIQEINDRINILIS